MWKTISHMNISVIGAAIMRDREKEIPSKHKALKAELPRFDGKHQSVHLRSSMNPQLGTMQRDPLSRYIHITINTENKRKREIL